MTCPATCPIFITCMKKNNPPAACLNKGSAKVREPWGNAMLHQELKLRGDAINFKGDWSV